MTTNLDTAHRTALPVAGAATAVLAVVQGVFGSVGVLIEPLAAAHATDRGLLVLLFPAALAVHTFVARYAGRAADRFGPRPLLVAAACGMAVGLLTPALAAAPHAVIAGYGIGLGVASACTWVATATAVGTAFRGRAATAMGVLTAGPAAGGAVLAPTLTVLAPTFGVRPTCGLLALLGVLACGACAVVLRDHPLPSDSLPGSSAATDLRRVVIAAALMGSVVFLPLVHMVGTATRLGLTAIEGAAVLTVISVVSAATRLAAGRLSLVATLPALYRAAHVLVTGGFVVWAAATGGGATFTLLLAAAGIFGAGYGAWLALGPALLAEVCPPARLGNALGALTTAIGMGGVVGPALADPLVVSAPAGVWLGAAALALAAAVLFRVGTPEGGRSE
jgi:MFS family permease